MGVRSLSAYVRRTVLEAEDAQPASGGGGGMSTQTWPFPLLAPKKRAVADDETVSPRLQEAMRHGLQGGDGMSLPLSPKRRHLAADEPATAGGQSPGLSLTTSSALAVSGINMKKLPLPRLPSQWGASISGNNGALLQQQARTQHLEAVAMALKDQEVQNLPGRSFLSTSAMHPSGASSNGAPLGPRRPVESSGTASGQHPAGVAMGPQGIFQLDGGKASSSQPTIASVATTAFIQLLQRRLQPALPHQLQLPSAMTSQQLNIPMAAGIKGYGDGGSGSEVDPRFKLTGLLELNSLEVRATTGEPRANNGGAIISGSSSRGAMPNVAPADEALVQTALQRPPTAKVKSERAMKHSITQAPYLNSRTLM